jgi:hypothetical protein
MFTASFLFASLVWGSVGVGYFIYGKKQQSLPAMVGGSDGRGVVFRHLRPVDVVDLRCGGRGGLSVGEAGIMSVPSCWF